MGVPPARAKPRVGGGYARVHGRAADAAQLYASLGFRPKPDPLMELPLCGA